LPDSGGRVDRRLFDALKGEGNEKEKEDTHRMGKYCGYDLLPDGSIKIAPTYVTEFEEVQIELRAIENILRMTTKQCYELQKPAIKRQKALWDRIAYDYGLDLTLNAWSYYSGDSTVKVKQPEGE